MAVGKAPVQLRLTNGDRLGGPFQRDPLPLIDYLTEVSADGRGSLEAQLVLLRRDRGGTALIVVTGQLDLESRADDGRPAPPVRPGGPGSDGVPADASPGPPGLDHRGRPLSRRTGPSLEHLGVEMTSVASSIARARGRLAPTPWATVEAVAVPAALSAATFLAATPWLRAYAVRGATPLFAGASVASVLIASLAIRVWRLPAAVSYAVSAAALVILLLASAGLHPDAIGRSLVNGPNELLTETLPLTGQGASLAAPLCCTWLCGTCTTELVSADASLAARPPWHRPRHSPGRLRPRLRGHVLPAGTQ